MSWSLVKNSHCKGGCITFGVFSCRCRARYHTEVGDSGINAASHSGNAGELGGSRSISKQSERESARAQSQHLNQFRRGASQQMRTSAIGLLYLLRHSQHYMHTGMIRKEQAFLPHCCICRLRTRLDTLKRKQTKSVLISIYLYTFAVYILNFAGLLQANKNEWK